MDAPDQDEEVIQNKTPELITGAFSTGLQFVEQYGWFLLVAGLALLYIITRYVRPQLSQWKQQQEDASYKKMDSGTAQSRLEGMERARQKMQEQLDRQAAEYKIKQKEKEEKARQEKIEDWERHQEGKGYRSKTKARDENDASPAPPKPKPKKPLRDPDYNPLMGNSGGACFRPPRRGASGGG